MPYQHESYAVLYSPDAARRLRVVSGLRRRELMKRVAALAADGSLRHAARTVGVGTRWDVAACELLHGERKLYVHSVVARRDALRALVGEEIHDRWLAKVHGRLTHGRWH